MIELLNMEIWFDKKNNWRKAYNGKLLSFRFLPQHWKKVSCSTNGAIKGIDKCYDLNINFLGLFFSYTNFDYNLQ